MALWNGGACVASCCWLLPFWRSWFCYSCFLTCLSCSKLWRLVAVSNNIAASYGFSPSAEMVFPVVLDVFSMFFHDFWWWFTWVSQGVWMFSLIESPQSSGFFLVFLRRVSKTRPNVFVLGSLTFQCVSKLALFQGFGVLAECRAQLQFVGKRWV